jgi:autoinducer 2 (AI-2) kinase
LGKKVMIRDSYRQSSVVGGVLICNNALGKPQPAPVTLEVVAPAPQNEYKTLYADWKNARSHFKKMLS